MEKKRKERKMKNRNRKLDENGEKNEWRIRKARVLSKESWLKKKENGGKEYYFRYRKGFDYK